MDDKIPVSESPARVENARSVGSVFVEHNSAFRLIHRLTRQSCSPKEMDETVADLRIIFDKYLELPSLLDKYIEEMVSELSSVARSLLDDSSIFKQESFWVTPLPRILSVLYTISKVRGRKRVQKFLPHQVKDVQAVLSALQSADDMCLAEKSRMSESDLGSGPQLWESIYILWNWMGILSLIPFDSSLIVDEQKISELVELAKKHLSEAGPTREMAAACLAQWLCRPDLEQKHLKSFKVWSIEILNGYLERPGDVFRTMGVLQTLVTILKVSKADRAVLLKLVLPLWPTMLRISESRPSNLLLRRYLVKWWTRAGTAYMPPRVAIWRYRRGRRSLKENLLHVNVEYDAQFVNDGPIEEKAHALKQGSSDFFQVPDQVEEAMGEVISSLTDPSTIVRWSAAKAIGRITERLPKICADDVLDAILESFDDLEKDNDWHGACLALAELARRGLLLPHRLEAVIHKVVQAIHYDVPRRQSSVGAHVRDAACYTYWAMARAYSPNIMKPFVVALSQSVITAFLFDREVNCRRAASAAFQEFVGRQGASNFKHGISILTTADYFSLGNRADAYLSIAIAIAEYEEYRKPIIDHLYKVKLSHWDPNVRLLSARALGKLAPMDTVLVGSALIPYLLSNCLDERNVRLRHGSVLGLAEIVLALGVVAKESGSFDRVLSKEALSAIADLVPIIEKKRLYRGKGGEQMRDAVCRLIECISIALIPLTVPLQVRLLDSIDACIPHPNEGIQNQATTALSALMRSYFPVSAKGPTDRLQKRVVDKYVHQVKTSINPAVTKGFTMALGRLPAKLLSPSSKVVDLSLACLCRIARPDATIGSDKDAETRRNALIALTQICMTVGVARPVRGEDECIVALTPEQIGHVFTALFRGMNDYNMERRGDVGSMSRIAAMEGLIAVALTAIHTSDKTEMFLSRETRSRLIGGLLKQLSEKLDAVRNVAGQCLIKILSSKEEFVPERDHLLTIFGNNASFEADVGTNWADASATFPLAVKGLEIDAYFEYIVSGLVISVGCLTQSVAKEASSALLHWFKGSTTDQVDRFGSALLRIFEKHGHEGRVILPLLKTISLLINRMCIERLVQDKEFSSKLLMHLRQEELKCKDVHRLTAIVDVSIGLLDPDNCPIQKTVLAFACKLLMHPYPRVRRITAESLYVRLLDTPDNVGYGEAQNFLLDSHWDADGSDSTVKTMAMVVSKSLQVDQLLEESCTSNDPLCISP